MAIFFLFRNHKNKSEYIAPERANEFKRLFYHIMASLVVVLLIVTCVNWWQYKPFMAFTSQVYVAGRRKNKPSI